MLESIITSTTGESFTLTNTLIIITSSILLGIVISLAYLKTHKKDGYIPSFIISLIMLPTIISIIILLVGNNVARAFSLAGAFSIIRFRSTPGDTKDISYIFFTLAVGLASGMGYVGYAVIFTIILCTVMIILDSLNFAMPKSKAMVLKITVPEDLNFEGVFDEILNTNTTSWNMVKVRTRDFGALYELNYSIHIKNDVNQKKFIDSLRVRNGNLNISLTSCGSEDKIFN